MKNIKSKLKDTLETLGYSITKIKKDSPQAYYCKALTGMSNYNISINSDLTVSCTC